MEVNLDLSITRVIHKTALTESNRVFAFVYAGSRNGEEPEVTYSQ